MTNIEKAEQKLINLCKKYKVRIDWEVFFPDYKDKPLPPDIQRAIKLLTLKGMKVLFTLKNIDISNKN